MQNECSPSGAEVRQRNSRQDCGQMIKTSKIQMRTGMRMRSHTDKTRPGSSSSSSSSSPPQQQQGRHNLTKTRPRLLGSGRSVGFIHSFIMLTLLNLILLLYHLEAPRLLVTGGGGGGRRNAPVLLFAQAAEESESMIELKRFLVPAQVRPGELRRLACQYELHGSTLHAMKLFKDDREFYRYTPSNPPSDQRLVFQAAGVQVDMNRSGEREVWLKINKRSTGQYKCQVTIEGKFISVSAEKRMEVITGTGSAMAGGSDLSTGGVGTQTGGGMWRHHPATPAGSSGPRLPPPTYLNQDQLSVRRPPGEMYGLNTVMQSSSSTGVVHRPTPILCACLLASLTGCSLIMATRAHRPRLR